MISFIERSDLVLDITEELRIIIEESRFYEEINRSEVYLKNRFSEDLSYWHDPEPRLKLSPEELNEFAAKHSNDPEVSKLGMTRHFFNEAWKQGLVNYMDSDYKYWNKEVPQKVREAVEKIGVDFHKITLNELKPHTGLVLHRDGVRKYHYPVITNPHCFMYDASNVANQKVYHLEQGKLYNVDTCRDHYVYNASDETRYHMIMSYGRLGEFDEQMG